jgi:hypothetical protein
MIIIQRLTVIRRKFSKIQLSSGQWFLLLYAQGLLGLAVMVYLLKFAMKFL